MTHTTTTLWTCARCGAQETVDGTGQPKDWVRAYFSSPPHAANHDAGGDLCNPCGGYLVSFVHGTETEDMAKDAEVARVVREVIAEMQLTGEFPSVSRYEKLAEELLAAPDPVRAIASLLGDHEGRLDALVRRLDGLDAHLAARHDA